MTEEDGLHEPTPEQPTTKPAASTRLVVVFAVIAVFAGVIVAKYLPPSWAGGNDSPAAQASLTSVRNDATADYEAAVKSGKPIYVMFHSMS
ncbi:MAG: hypothetical protein U1E26_03110 [Coriobacteriia bacterium]|nr:hypothetical protein [Coriobacteriia bacterium]